MIFIAPLSANNNLKLETFGATSDVTFVKNAAIVGRIERGYQHLPQIIRWLSYWSRREFSASVSTSSLAFRRDAGAKGHRTRRWTNSVSGWNARKRVCLHSFARPICDNNSMWRRSKTCLQRSVSLDLLRSACQVTTPYTHANTRCIYFKY